MGFGLELGSSGFDDQQDPLDIGLNADAADNNEAVALGNEASVTAWYAVSLGTYASATSASAVAIGQSADADGQESVAIGDIAHGRGDYSVSIGRGTRANTQSVSIGYNDTQGDYDDYVVQIGNQTEVAGGRSVAIGNLPYANGHAVAIGNDARGEGLQSVAVGRGSRTSASRAISIGRQDSTGEGADGAESIAIGYGANTTAEAGTAVGRSTSVTANYATAIGDGTSATGWRSAVIGYNASVDTDDVARIATDQLVFGGTRDTLADTGLNNGELTVELDETNAAFRLRGRDSGGTIREATVAW